MGKESIEQEEKKQVAMVECPFCNKPIEAPAKADVIFECPHCHKELITYEKTSIKTYQKSSNNMSLIYCKECGMQISSEASNCPHCGYPQNGPSNNSEISLGYLFISFLIPLIGIILICISWNKNEGNAKSALIGTLVGIILTFAVYYSMF